MAKDKEKVHRGGCTTKELSFWAIGFVTLLYTVFEIVVALYQSSLTLMSDGFHNLSDVISLGIAYWASKATRRGMSDDMTFGWARTEILGALINGTFLLSLCLYIALESIPEIIDPSADISGGWLIGVGAAGVFVNTLGTVVFAITGQAHGHSHAHGHGHGHGHGGDDHGHSHGGKDHGHAHDEKSKLLDHSDHGHSHGGDDHGHAHGGDDHGHSHGGDDHGHSHGGGGHDDHGHGPKKGMCSNFDMNTYAVFIHYLGDMISSVFVVIAGIAMLIWEDDTWSYYIDPVASWIIIGLILFTTWPLVKRCGLIMLQSTPAHIDVAAIKRRVTAISGVINVHDVHIWQLTDGMVICSLHIGVEESTDTHFSDMSLHIKSILHEYGIHSSAIQPEFLAMYNSEVMSGEVCAQNCVEECEEDWCCAKEADSKPATQYSVDTVSFQNFQPFHEEA